MRRIIFGLTIIFISHLCFSQNSWFIAGKASAVSGFTDDKKDANSNGVFPVLLKWNLEGISPEKIDIFRNDEKIATLAGAEKEFLDKNESAMPCEKYRYKMNVISQGKNVYSAEDIGYGALTAVCYMLEYNKTTFSSYDKLTLMNKKSNLSKLGKESINGEFSGQLIYNAKVQGLLGVVYMDYINYSDKENWILDGSSNTRANVFGTGKMFGTMNCSGMYPGSISYDELEIKKGKAGGGYCTVIRAGFEPSVILWDEITHARIASDD